MVMASGRWLGVRLDLLSSLLTGAVAFAAVLVSQDAGRYTLSELFSSRARNYSTSLTLMPSLPCRVDLCIQKFYTYRVV